MKNIAVVDLAYGDSGKGVVVNRLCNEMDVGLVVRYNGGCQAAHNVVLDDGRHHTFAQFGSGTFWRVPTFFSKFAMFEPLSAVIEGRALEANGVERPFDLLFVSGEALMTTPYHWLLNRWREDQRGDGRHGSCGRGVGATAEYALLDNEALRFGELIYKDATIAKLEAIRDWAIIQSDGEIAAPHPNEVWLQYAEARSLIRIGRDEDLHFNTHKPIVFEGAQGVLLDEDWGFHPYTTWSHTTTRNARQLVDEYELGELEEIGVVRAYSTRHGAGPFVPEDNSLDLPEPHNKREHYQGGWRVGHFDGPAIRYAIDVNGGVDSVYVTHVDAANNEPRLQACVGYELNGWPAFIAKCEVDDFEAREVQAGILSRAKPSLITHAQRWDKFISWYLGLPLAGVGYGPSTSDGDFRELAVA